MKLDVVFSIGPACRPAYHLASNGFRKFAAPLDWQMGYSLETVLQLFKTGFYDFFVEIEEDDSYEGEMRKVWDVRNKVCSIHHFSRDVDLKQNQEIFREKMRRRYERLDKKIKESSSIGLVCNRNLEIEQFKTFLLEFSQIYPQKKIILINIKNEDTKEKRIEKYDVNENLEIHQYILFDEGESGTHWWIGNSENWYWVLNHYELGYRKVLATLQPVLNEKSLVVYGAGVIAKRVIEILRRNHIKVDGIAVTKMDGNPSEVEGIKVKSIEVYDGKNTFFLVAVGKEDVRKEMLAIASEHSDTIGYIDINCGEIKVI